MGLKEIQAALAGSTPTFVDPAPGAAVALILRAEPELSALLIRRATRQSDPWSGQMALPGGRAQSEDEDLLQTAIRETEEEVGLRLERSMCIGPLDDTPTHKKSFAVRTYVFTAREPGPLTLEESEVDVALWQPLLPLASGEGDTTYPYRSEKYGEMKFPGFTVEPGVVWGLTYRILRVLFRVSGLRP